MSSFYCTFCCGYVYMADLYSPFGDGGLAICKDCIIQAIEDILSINGTPGHEDFIGRLAWVVLRAKANDAELEGLTPQEVIQLARTGARREPPGKGNHQGGSP